MLTQQDVEAIRLIVRDVLVHAGLAWPRRVVEFSVPVPDDDDRSTHALREMARWDVRLMRGETGALEGALREAVCIDGTALG